MSSTSSLKHNMESEWDRVSQNPDNMMVSDSLRSVLSDILSAPSQQPATRPTATLIGGDTRIDIPVSRIERSRAGCLISGTASYQDGLTIIRSEAGSWRALSVSSEQGGEVFSQALGIGWNVTVSVDFTDLTDLCSVTVSFERAGAQAQHL